MARTRKRRRTEDEVRELALDLAKSGPFAPADLADKAGFSGNRARQILEGLGEKKKLVILGLRKSPRGKPANLWGFPGTKVTEADKQPRPRSTAPTKARPMGKVRSPRSDARISTRTGAGGAATRVISALDPGLVLSLRRVLDRLSVHGFEVEGPAGLTFRIRLGGMERISKERTRKPRRKRKAVAAGRAATGTGTGLGKSGSAENTSRPARRTPRPRKVPVRTAVPEESASAPPN